MGQAGLRSQGALGAIAEFLMHSWWDYKLVRPLWNIIWRFLKKLKVELPYAAAIPLLGVHPREITL